jgi:hypothetical protein
MLSILFSPFLPVPHSEFRPAPDETQGLPLTLHGSGRIPHFIEKAPRKKPLGDP